MVVLIPTTVPAMVMPTALLPVFVLISVAIGWCRRVNDRRRLVDNRWRLVDDGRRCYVYRAGNPKIDSDVCVGQSGA